ncbi:MAG: DUF4911 domain-containing protein [Desulfobacteraceae bacterium]|nr:DUF4911 domain-containing protein [Desulfobacteraceae bacterium]
MQPQAQSCIIRNYIIAPYEIHYLRFIVEAYEGIGVVSTIDSALGLVSIAIAPGCESDLAAILDAERDNLKLREVLPEESATV